MLEVIEGVTNVSPSKWQAAGREKHFVPAVVLGMQTSVAQ